MHVDYPSPLNITPWPAEVGVRCFDARHPYVAHCWAWTLGPSSIAALSLFAELLNNARSVTVDLDQFADALGISYGGGAHSTLCRTLQRLERFGMAIALPDDTYAVRTAIPSLSARQLHRAPALVVALHRRHTTAERQATA
ncbi:MAG TPA: hypothetical protein VHA73_05440 [Acidimicrobiales bacterium]|jgi:hypothetical protein|nr:hypothetical protein [Acidimicrobiales bacterium]